MEVRIFSARCFGVYDSGEAKRRQAAVVRRQRLAAATAELPPRWMAGRRQNKHRELPPALRRMHAVAILEPHWGQRISSLPHLRLGLLQPEPHVHLAVHRRRGGEVLLGLLALARAPVELAEAEVAVGDEGAHAEFGGKG